MERFQCIRSICHHRPDGRKPANVISDLQAEVRFSDSPDHYGQGDLISDFEKKVAELLGMENAVFLPTGTMAQQIALRVWCELSEISNVAFSHTCHLELHEEKGYSFLHGLHSTLLGSVQRPLRPGDFEQVSNSCSAVLVELPEKEFGGHLMEWRELVSVATRVRSMGVKLHLDGARLWECVPAYGKSLAQIASLFDSVYVSFYKSLGAIGGAALAGSSEFISEVRIWQRRCGGNMVELWPYVLSARYALAHRRKKIPIYVEHMKATAKLLDSQEFIKVIPAEPKTNMAQVHLHGNKAALIKAADAISTRTKVWLFGDLTETNWPNWYKFDFVAGEGSLEVSPEETTALLQEVVSRAAPHDRKS